MDDHGLGVPLVHLNRFSRLKTGKINPHFLALASGLLFSLIFARELSHQSGEMCHALA